MDQEVGAKTITNDAKKTALVVEPAEVVAAIVNSIAQIVDQWDNATETEMERQAQHTTTTAAATTTTITIVVKTKQCGER